jgi:hypothetical protein
MNDEIKKKTKTAANNKAAEHPPEQALGDGNIAGAPNFPFTICYVIGGLMVGLASVSFIGSIHNILTATLCALGIIFVVVGAVIHIRYERQHQNKPFNLKKILTVSTRILIIVVIGVFLYVSPRIGEYLARWARTPATPTNKTEVLPDGRILLSDMTPEYLKYLYSEYTNAQAAKLMEPYWDKWVIINGTVRDLQIDSDKDSLLLGNRPEPFSLQSAHFDDATQIERLKPLSKGNPVKVICKIKKSSFDFTLEQCELLSPE